MHYFPATKEWFARFLAQTVFPCLEKLRAAGHAEYAHSEESTFANFERLSAQLGIPREKVLWVYATKHLDGIASYLNGHTSQREDVRGRIQDAIVYLSLLWGMIEQQDPMSPYRREHEQALEKREPKTVLRGKDLTPWKTATGTVPEPPLSREVLERFWEELRRKPYSLGLPMALPSIRFGPEGVQGEMAVLDLGLGRVEPLDPPINPYMESLRRFNARHGVAVPEGWDPLGILPKTFAQACEKYGIPPEEASAVYSLVEEESRAMRAVRPEEIVPPAEEGEGYREERDAAELGGACLPQDAAMERAPSPDDSPEMVRARLRRKGKPLLPGDPRYDNNAGVMA